MSTTYDLECLDCKEQIWIGQRDYIYTGEPQTMELLRVFLFVHLRHNLRFVSEHDAHDTGIDGWVRIIGDDDPHVPENWIYYKKHWTKQNPNWTWFLRESDAP